MYVPLGIGPLKWFVSKLKKMAIFSNNPSCEGMFPLKLFLSILKPFESFNNFEISDGIEPLNVFEVNTTAETLSNKPS